MSVCVCVCTCVRMRVIAGSACLNVWMRSPGKQAFWQSDQQTELAIGVAHNNSNHVSTTLLFLLSCYWLWGILWRTRVGPKFFKYICYCCTDNN